MSRLRYRIKAFVHLRKNVHHESLNVQLAVRMDDRATVEALLAVASARANELPGVDDVEFKFLQNSQRDFVGNEDVLSDVVRPDEPSYALTPLAVRAVLRADATGGRVEPRGQLARPLNGGGDGGGGDGGGGDGGACPLCGVKRVCEFTRRTFTSPGPWPLSDG